MKINNNKILVLGSNGFLGKNLIHELKELEIDFQKLSGKNELDLYRLEEFQNYLNESKIEIIINCSAFVGGIEYGYKYPADLLIKNTTIANNIYSASVNTNVKKIINPISNCAYPENLTVYKENQFWDGKPHESVFHYGIAKRHIVALADAFFKQHDISSVNVVLSNMYGPLDHFEESRSHALGALIKKIYFAKMNNLNEVEIWGTGKPIREWLYVVDGANALINSIELKKGNYFFNIGVNEGISVSDLATLIAKSIGFKGKFIFNNNKPDGVLRKTVDGEIGSSFLDWKPKIDLETGINLTVNWYIKNYEQLYS